MKTVSLVTLVTLCLGQIAVGQMSNHIVKESVSSSSSSTDPETSNAPPPPPPPPAVPASYGPLLASLFAGGTPAAAPPAPPAAAPLPGVPAPPPPAFDPILGGSMYPGGYAGFPGFMGPSYLPQTWIGSALGAKGDLLFPIVIFVFVIVGIWTVVQFLLALIVPLIAGKLSLDKAILGGKFARAAGPDPWDAHQQRVDDLTHNVMPALDNNYGDDIEDINAY